MHYIGVYPSTVKRAMDEAEEDSMPFGILFMPNSDFKHIRMLTEGRDVRHLTVFCTGEDHPFIQAYMVSLIKEGRVESVQYHLVTNDTK